MTKIFIFGLGLIGGSIAKKLKSSHKDKYTVYALTKTENDIENALSDGSIDKGFTILPEDSYFDFDIVLLAVPPEKICTVTKDIMRHFSKDVIYTDVGSIKSKIEAGMKELGIQYVGGHPMAGTEKKGYKNSFSHLFENAYYFLTSKNEKVLELVNDLGAIPVFIDAQTHDKTVAAISHVPHALSAGLVNLAINNETEDKLLSKAAAGGFRDTTRIAASDEHLWEEILFSNKKYVIPLLEEYEKIISNLRNAVINNDSDAVLSYFRNAKIYRKELEENRQPLQRQYFDIYISVADRVGVIADISKILTDNNINIKNIGVLKSREQIGGTLILSVYSLADFGKSKALLKDKFEISD